MPLLAALIIVVLLIAVGAAVIGLVFNLIWYAIVGLVVGGIGRMLAKDSRDMGLLMTILYGLAGAFLGGILADLLDVGWLLSLVLSVLIAGILVSLFASRRASSRG